MENFHYIASTNRSKTKYMRLTFLKFISIIVLFNYNYSVCQTYSKTYLSSGTTNGNDFKEEVQVLSDKSSLILFPDYRLMKLDASGNILWSVKVTAINSNELTSPTGLPNGQRFCVVSETPLKIAIVTASDEPTPNDYIGPSRLSIISVAEVSGAPVVGVHKTIDCGGPLTYPPTTNCYGLLPMQIIYSPADKAYFISGYRNAGVAGPPGMEGYRYINEMFIMRVSATFVFDWLKVGPRVVCCGALPNGYTLLPYMNITSDGLITTSFHSTVGTGLNINIKPYGYMPSVLKIDPNTGNVVKRKILTTYDKGSPDGVYTDFYEDGGRLYFLYRGYSDVDAIHVYDLGINTLIDVIAFTNPTDGSNIRIRDIVNSSPNEASVLADGFTNIASQSSLFKYNFSAGIGSILAEYPLYKNKLTYKLSNYYLASTSLYNQYEVSKTDATGKGSGICYFNANAPKINHLTGEINDDPLDLKDFTTSFEIPTFTTDVTANSTIECSPVSSTITKYLCEGSNVTFCANPDATGIIWSNGASTNCITVSTPGTYSYTAASISSATTFYVETFNVVFVPLSGITITGPANKCVSPQTYAVTGFPAGSTFSWSTTAGTIVSGIGTSSITINWLGSDGSASTVTCIVTTPEGCTKKLTFNAIPCCPDSDVNALTTPFGGTTTMSSLITAHNTAFPSALIVPVGGYYFISPSQVSQIFVNNTLIIDVPTKIDNLTVKIGPNENIKINSGQTLLTTRSVYTAKCNYMWDGIYVADNTALFDGTDTKLEQSFNAIVSNNGGVIKCRSTVVNTMQFKNCIEGILFNNAPGTNSSSITGTLFHKSGTFLPPMSFLVRGKAGIAIEGNNSAGSSSLTIGSNTDLPNTFKNLTYGIADKYYNIDCNNNIFSNILTGTSIPGIGINTACIAATADKLKPITVNVNGVSPTGVNNDFKQSTFGVHTNNYVNLNVKNNKFNQVDYGVRATDHPGRTVVIDNNIIKNFIIGVETSGNSKANISILNNDINIGVPPVAFGIGNVAIYLNDPPYAFYKAKIINNDIKNIRTGIWVKGAESSDLSNPILIDANHVTFNGGISPSATNVYYGIRLEYSNEIDVTGNFVKANGSPPISAIRDYLRGISVEFSKNTDVASNPEIRKMGSGAYVFDDCSYTRFSCNQFFSCYDACNFSGTPTNANAATITHELELTAGVPTPTGDVFTGSIDADLTGKINPEPAFGGIVKWYFLSSTPMPTSTLIAGSISTNFPIATSNPVNCSGILGLSPPTIKRATTTEKIINNTLVFNSSQHKYNSHKFALSYLRQHNLIVLGASDDANYILYNYNQLLTNHGKFQLITEHIEDGNYFSADSINSTVIDTNLIEFNSKLVNEIYLNRFLLGALTSSDSIILKNLALADLGLNGEAVFFAQIMMRMDVPYFGIFARQNVPVSDVMIDLKEKIKIFPNPSDDKFSITI